MTRPRIALALIAALVVGGWLFARSEAGQFLLGRWSFTQSAWFDRGTYFRLKVKLTYKGEPQDFDIVVGCNVHRIHYKDGSGTYEAGLVPTVYGRRMSDGKGLVIRAPDACEGQTTANGRVPENFMPVIIVYDDANTLAFGTAYISDDAYASPLSLLTFGGATVEAATRAEFDAFRKDGPPNLVTREIYHSVQPQDVVEKMGLRKVWPEFGNICRAFQRVTIPETLRKEMLDYWPVSRPNYWQPATQDDWATAYGSIIRTLRNRDEPSPAPLSDFDDHGAIRSDGRGWIGQGHSRLANPSFFPFESDLAANRWPAIPAKWWDFASSLSSLLIADVAYEKEHQGFGYCYARPGLMPDSAIFEIIETIPAKFKVNSVDVYNSPRVWTRGDRRKTYFLDKDVYYADEINLDLLSVGGDV